MCLIHKYTYRWFKSIGSRGCRPNIASKECYTSVYILENGGLRATNGTICRPSLAADTLEYRHINLNSFLVRLRCRQAYLSASSMSTSCRGYLTATGDRFQQVPLAVFDPGVRFRRGIVYVDSTRTGLLKGLIHNIPKIVIHFYLNFNIHTTIVA